MANKNKEDWNVNMFNIDGTKIQEHLAKCNQLLNEHAYLLSSIPRAKLFDNFVETPGSTFKKDLRTQIDMGNSLLESFEGNPHLRENTRQEIREKNIRLNISLQFYEAFCCFSDGDFRNAIAAIEQCIVHLLELLKEINVKKLNHKTKKDLYNLASAIYNCKGMIHRTRGNLVEAFRNYHIAIMINRDDHYAYSNMGFLLSLEMKLNERAYRYHRIAIRRSNDVFIINGLGDVMAELATDVKNKRFNRAQLEKYVNEDERLSDDHQSCTEEWENPAALLDKSLSYYQRATKLEKSPESTDFSSLVVYENRALIYFEQGRVGLAIVDSLKATKVHPPNGRSFYYLGYFYAVSKQYSEAIEAFEKAKNLLVEDSVFYNFIIDAIVICEGKRSTESLINVEFSCNQSDIDYHDLNGEQLLSTTRETIHKRIEANQEEKEQIIFPLYIESLPKSKVHADSYVGCFVSVVDWIKSKNEREVVPLLDVEEGEKLSKASSNEAKLAWIKKIYNLLYKKDRGFLRNLQAFHRQRIKETYDAMLEESIANPFKTPSDSEICNIIKNIQNPKPEALADKRVVSPKPKKRESKGNAEALSARGIFPPSPIAKARNICGLIKIEEIRNAVKKIIDGLEVNLKDCQDFKKECDEPLLQGYLTDIEKNLNNQEEQLKSKYNDVHSLFAVKEIFNKLRELIKLQVPKREKPSQNLFKPVPYFKLQQDKLLIDINAKIFTEVLNEIKQRAEKNSLVAQKVFICYPPLPEAKDDSMMGLDWVYPFLDNICKHIKEGGISNITYTPQPGERTENHLKNAENADVILLMGTEFFLANRNQDNSYVSKALAYIHANSNGRKIPILLNGNKQTSLPSEFNDIEAELPATKTYLQHFQYLIATLYNTRIETFKDIWESAKAKFLARSLEIMREPGINKNAESPKNTINASQLFRPPSAALSGIIPRMTLRRARSTPLCRFDGSPPPTPRFQKVCG